MIFVRFDRKYTKIAWEKNICQIAFRKIIFPIYGNKTNEQYLETIFCWTENNTTSQ